MTEGKICNSVLFFFLHPHDFGQCVTSSFFLCVGQSQTPLDCEHMSQVCHQLVGKETEKGNKTQLIPPAFQEKPSDMDLQHCHRSQITWLSIPLPF
jgi:hypothetical protein